MPLRPPFFFFIIGIEGITPPAGRTGKAVLYHDNVLSLQKGRAHTSGHRRGPPGGGQRRQRGGPPGHPPPGHGISGVHPCGGPALRPSSGGCPLPLLAGPPGLPRRPVLLPLPGAGAPVPGAAAGGYQGVPVRQGRRHPGGGRPPGRGGFIQHQRRRRLSGHRAEGPAGRPADLPLSPGRRPNPPHRPGPPGGGPDRPPGASRPGLRLPL